MITNSGPGRPYVLSYLHTNNGLFLITIKIGIWYFSLKRLPDVSKNNEIRHNMLTPINVVL